MDQKVSGYCHQPVQSWRRNQRRHLEPAGRHPFLFKWSAHRHQRFSDRDWDQHSRCAQRWHRQSGTIAGRSFSRLRFSAPRLSFESLGVVATFYEKYDDTSIERFCGLLCFCIHHDSISADTLTSRGLSDRRADSWFAHQRVGLHRTETYLSNAVGLCI